MNIDVSEKTYSRLSEIRKGFETPDEVISRIIDEVTGQPKEKPDVFFDPQDEQLFKKKLLETRRAEVCLYYSDGSHAVSLWKADKLTEDSNLRGNIGSGLLRDWKKKAIVRLELRVLSGSEDIAMLGLAHALNITYSEAVTVKPKKHREDMDRYLISFENEDMSILNKVYKLNNDLEVYLPTMMVDAMYS